MGTQAVSGAGGAAPRQQEGGKTAARSAAPKEETKSIYEMMRDAREKAEARRDRFKTGKNTRYGDAPLEAYARLARARTQSEVGAASGFARRKILQMQSALRQDPDNKDRIQAAIRQLQKAVTRAGRKKRDLQREELTDIRRKKAAEEKQRRKAQQLRQELSRTRAMRSIRESGYMQEAEMDNRAQEQLSAVRLELRTQLQQLTAAAAGVSKEAAVHQYAAQAETAAAEAVATAGPAEAGTGLNMLA